MARNVLFARLRGLVGICVLITGLSAQGEPVKTADQQANDKPDLVLTAKIRRALVKDDNLSLSAHNVKIIAQSGFVTLRGPVRSTFERIAVADTAMAIAGAKNVRNELAVAP